MRVHLGTDHAAFDTKNAIAAALREHGHEVVDHGASVYDADDDYPTFVIPAAEAVVADPGSFGIVLGGSGNGEAIAANKVRGVRAALVHNLDTAQLARAHNDANVAAIGARQHSEDECVELALAFLAAPFSGDNRHSRRLALVSRYEADGVLGA
ncbi:MAG: ribose-5-phosphate isomerase [Propionibacteriaceae bacterium]|jgi:ribose 5-phosphate isomerase B|nr:ribose-5-phosphate isomerase [Propionibacteriaceae bacterium]